MYNSFSTAGISFSLYHIQIILVLSFLPEKSNIHIILFQAVLNQKFTDCFVLVFLDTQAGKTVSSYTESLLSLSSYC